MKIEHIAMYVRDLEGMKEGHRALKENGVKFAFVTDMLRTLRVLKQFL